MNIKLLNKSETVLVKTAVDFTDNFNHTFQVAVTFNKTDGKFVSVKTLDNETLLPHEISCIKEFVLNLPA